MRKASLTFLLSFASMSLPPSVLLITETPPPPPEADPAFLNQLNSSPLASPLRPLFLSRSISTPRATASDGVNATHAA